jgi:TonB family protein
MLSVVGLISLTSEAHAQEVTTVLVDGSVLRVEGANFVSNNNAPAPLCIVNDVVVPYEELVNLNAEDIASVTIYNDAESLSLYSRFGDVSNGVLVVDLVDKEEVFVMVDTMPMFMNGDISTFRNWVMQNIRYPEAALQAGIQGAVFVQFVVGSDGYISPDRISILQSPDDMLRDEVLRVIQLSPRWTPGVQRGQNVAVSFTIPIIFSLS